jgi:hypothetical protein
MSIQPFNRAEIDVPPSHLLSELSEADQESLSGGFIFYFNEIEINSSASNQTDYTGSVTPGGSGGSTVTGDFSGNSNSNYSLKQRTFFFSASDSMLIYGLSGFLKWAGML